jgi:RNA polymerase sigma factor (sigma-70 family)
MTLTKEELNSIITGCTQQDKTSQELLFKYFYGKMMIVCSRYARSKDEAKDVLQDGFIKLFDNLYRYEVTGSIEGWVRRIFVNTAIDHFRKHKNKFNIEDEGRLKDESVSYEEENESKYSHIKPEDILTAMEKLSPAYRTVFNLYAIENYTHKEIAEILDINIGTSKSNYAKAKSNLKSILQERFAIVK